ncbi:hypothetical protein MSHRCOH1_03790 [Candidatus Ornithobacterium hominis]|uniref:DUF6883 domain-containing protein n=1 Tax=Candidatus Ornithobacterium hominis TaxID=2497989 RepID=UPI0024BC70BB|nr:DUF6883 domain-containing protein [Candidatus Ornithobacterium hominis]CAI9429312.1 hypothetical protein MSHRCOH1_03790 [Candidatus Ornithobacterium hominis]
MKNLLYILLLIFSITFGYAQGRAVYEVLKDTERLKQATQAIKQQLSEYVGETANASNQARYNQGKLTFDIVTLFVGVGEVKALLKGEKTVAQLFSKIGKLPKDAITEIRKIKKPKRGDAKRIFEKVRKGKVIGKIGNTPIKSVYGDIRKFSEYALTNPSKKGLFVDSWGYKLDDAERLLEIYRKQAIEAVKNGKVISSGVNNFGVKLYKIKTKLKTPSGKKVNIYAGWIIKPDKIDELILSTPFDGYVK